MGLPDAYASATTHGTAPSDTRSIRIECRHASRSATVHWPLEASAQCAQWLAAYLA
jgi:hypothetical protein